MARLYRRLIRRPRRARLIPSRIFGTTITIGKVTGTGQPRYFARFLGKVTGTSQAGRIVSPSTVRVTETGRWVHATIALDERGNYVATIGLTSLTERGERVLSAGSAPTGQTLVIGKVTGVGQVASLRRINKVTGTGHAGTFTILRQITIGKVIGASQAGDLTAAHLRILGKADGTGQVGHLTTGRAILKVTGTGLVRAITIVRAAPNFGHARGEDSAVGATASSELVGATGSEE